MSNIDNIPTSAASSVADSVERFETEAPVSSAPDSLYADVAADKAPAAAVERGTVIKGRWRPVMVEKIVDMQVVGVEHYDEEREVRLAGALFRKERSQRGMLKRAQLQVTVSLTEPIMASEMSANITTAFSVSSKNITVNVGTTQEAGEVKGERVFTVVVPLVDGLCEQLPLLDHVHSKGEHIVHTCVRIPGVNDKHLGVTHRIRLKVSDEFGTATIVSSGVDLFNTARISEAAANFGELVGHAKDAVVATVAGCWYRVRRKTEPRTDAVSVGDTPYEACPAQSQPQYIPVPVMMQMPASGQDGNGEQQMQPIPVYMPQNFAPQYPVKPSANANQEAGQRELLF